MKQIAKLMMILVTGMVAIHAHALTFTVDDYICPIGGEKFTQQTDASGTSFGQTLDLKPIGPIAAPSILPECPQNKFVFFKSDFTQEDIKKLTPYVNSDAYKALHQETSYYRAAQLQRLVDTPQEVIAYTLIKATWQAAGSQHYQRYAKEALTEYKAYLTTIDEQKDMEKWVTAQLLSLELERRMGDFSAAKVRLVRLKESQSLEGDFLISILKLQEKLIDEKNTNEHDLP